ncbi:MAG: chemotaxis protein CheW [Bacteriovoracia bacterium]
MNETNLPVDQKEKSVYEERFLAFTLCKEQYAIPLQQVKEVIGYQNATPVPQAPNYFKGVINLRGQIISIVDLRTKLKLINPELGPETAIIILDLNPFCLGVVVDTIDCVHAFAKSDIDDSNGIENYAKQHYITGIAKKDKQLVILLDVKATIDPADAQILNQNKKAA